MLPKRMVEISLRTIEIFQDEQLAHTNFFTLLDSAMLTCHGDHKVLRVPKEMIKDLAARSDHFRHARASDGKHLQIRVYENISWQNTNYPKGTIM
jgi:hypothetical protein